MFILKAHRPSIMASPISRLFSSHTNFLAPTRSGEPQLKYELGRQFRIYTDQEFRKQYTQRKRKERLEWYRDPKNQALALEAARARQRQRRRSANDSNLGPKNAFWKTALRRYAWVRDEIDWRSHMPVLSDVKIHRNCERCSFPPSNGAMLWWVCMPKSTDTTSEHGIT